jgi:nucleotide-binding universal stress UspA family protein
VRAGIRLARALGAKVTGVFVAPPYVPAMYGEAMLYVAGPSPAQYRKLMQARARKALALVESEARAARVRCATQLVIDPLPWQGLLRAARSRKCDAVAMASHGRGGLGGLLLGSETSRLLAHSKIPVLVTR